MEKYKLGEMEYKLACIIWGKSEISTKELIEICQEKFNWKRTTTYTMLKRLEKRKIFENSKGEIIHLMTKEEFEVGKGEKFLNESFNGSLPKFLAAFSKQNKLSEKEINEIKKLINDYNEEGEK